jgi:hypothetical protein
MRHFITATPCGNLLPKSGVTKNKLRLWTHDFLALKPLGFLRKRRTTMQNTLNKNSVPWMLFGLAALILLGTINGAVEGFFWVGAVALAFFYAYRNSHQHGLVVPAGVLAGTSLGILLEGITPFDGIFLFGLASGFWLIKLLEPKRHFWAQYPAWALTAIGGLVFVSENAWLVALTLIGLGIYLLGKKPQPTIEVTRMPVPEPISKRERLQAWRAEMAKQSGLPEPEILRGEQLERLSTMTPDNVDAMFGVLDTAQIERYGKQLLAVLR